MRKMALPLLQAKQLEALSEVDRICKKYVVPYYMIGGTLIGAVRHQGFIPWDDDIDLAMLREDYDRFLSCCPGELAEKYFLQNYHTDVDFYPALTRICIKGTFVQAGYSSHLNFNKAAYLDIFPLDNVPDEEGLLRKQEKQLKLIDTLLLHKARYVYRNGPLFTKLAAKKLLRALLLPIPLKVLQRSRERVMRRYAGRKTSRVCSTASKYGFRKQIMLREVYGEPAFLKFEQRLLPAPRRWDTYLTQIFGDYLAYPPEEMRQPCCEVYEIEAADDLKIGDGAHSQPVGIP